MMRNLLFIISVLLGTACEPSDSPATEYSTEKRMHRGNGESLDSLSGVKNNHKQTRDNWHSQTYPNSDQVKIEGAVDDNGKRHGIWKGYHEQGTLASMAEYHHGLKHGISIVYYPNGAINYRGEYKNNDPVGVWKVYDRKTGEVVSEKSYSKQ